MSAKVVLFESNAEFNARQNLDRFINFCKNQIEAFGAGLEFDSNEWDISNSVHLKAMGRKRIHLRFFAQGGLNQCNERPMPEPYISFAKAYTRYSFALSPRKQLGPPICALRMIHAALEERGTSDPTSIDAGVLNRAAALVKDAFSSTTAYGIGRQLQIISEFLSKTELCAAPINGWKNPIRRAEPRDRIGAEADQRRISKLPSAAALEALPKIFRLADDNSSIITSSIAALLCAAPDRINEVLLLPLDCEIRKLDSHGAEIFGLRWWTSKGSPPMIKWIVPSMRDVVIEAIQKIRAATASARAVAQWYEQNPNEVFLQSEYEYLRKNVYLNRLEIGLIVFGKPTHRGIIHAWCKAKNIKTVAIEGRQHALFCDIERIIIADLPRGFPILNPDSGLRYGDALFITLKNALTTDRSTWPGVVCSISVNQVNRRLGPTAGVPNNSIFERFGFTEPDGDPIKVTTHQFRHYLNTLAQAGGLSQLDIAKWSGRTNIHQNQAYDHVSSDELVMKIRSAMSNDLYGFGSTAQTYKTTLVSRDEFAKLRVPTAHTTEFGICIHDFTMAPCQLHADCLNCSEQVCIKGDYVREARIRAELETARENLRMAEDADVAGVFGANRWVSHHRLTIRRLEELCKIFDNPDVPSGAVIQPTPSNRLSNDVHKSSAIRIAADVDIDSKKRGGEWQLGT